MEIIIDPSNSGMDRYYKSFKYKRKKIVDAWIVTLIFKTMTNLNVRIAMISIFVPIVMKLDMNSNHIWRVLIKITINFCLLNQILFENDFNVITKNISNQITDYS